MSQELYHYGVLGMKWGVRRTPEQLGHRKSKSSKNVTSNWSDDAKAAAELRKKSVHELSNDELRRLNDRQNLEKNFRQATANRSTFKKAMAFVTAAATTMTALSNLYTSGKNFIGNGKKFAEGLANIPANALLKTKIGVL